MSAARTYLDWNATAPLRREARAAMVAALDVVGNPSSPHAEGRRTRAIVEDAREQIAALVGAKPAEVVFTSGGTEGNNTVLAGGWDAILVAGVEHDSVLAPARKSGARLIELPIDGDGATTYPRCWRKQRAAAPCSRCRWPITRPACCSPSPRWLAMPGRMALPCTPMRCRPPAASASVWPSRASTI